MNTQRNPDNLDMKLSSSGQQAIQEIVRSLPEDSLSMAWRASLNEHLRNEAKSYRPKRRFVWIFAPAAGLTFAACFAMLMLFHTPNRSNALVSDTSRLSATGSQSDSIVAGLFDTYRQESISHEIVGSGPDPIADSSHTSVADAATTESDSSEVDPDSL